MSEPQYHVERLAEPAPAAGPVATRSVDPAELARVFRASWSGVSRVRLAAGAAYGPRVLEHSEALVFVLAGAGTATLAHGSHPVDVGMALTLFQGERLDLVAADRGLEFFLVEMRVAAP